MDTATRYRRGLGLAVGAALAATGAASAQEAGSERVIPTNAFVATGYGTVGYAAETQGENVNAFTASFHPTWINKFPSSPPIYGHHVAQFGVEPLMPILSDIGVMARATATPGPWQLSLNAYVTQGPALEGEHGDPLAEEDFEAPEIAFPASSSDNNTGKMPGLRIDIALPPWFEVSGSWVNADYDDEGVLDFTGWNAAAEIRYDGLEVRGEYLQVRQEVETETGFPTLRRHGFYTQASYRFGPWEPVLRWTQVFDDRLDGETVAEAARQAAFGLDYWLTPSVALMAGYEVNDESGVELDNDSWST